MAASTWAWTPVGQRHRASTRAARPAAVAASPQLVRSNSRVIEDVLDLAQRTIRDGGLAEVHLRRDAASDAVALQALQQRQVTQLQARADGVAQREKRSFGSHNVKSYTLIRISSRYGNSRHPKTPGHVHPAHDPAPARVRSPAQACCANLLDALAGAPGTDAALLRIDAYRRLLAGPGIFSIQLNA